MDNRKWGSGASVNPPAAPAAPSSGYPTDGDPLASVPPTLPGAHWFYQVGEELRAILAAAGITPDHTSLTQLLTALRSAGVFQTPAQFDTSTKVATMEAVQRALGNHAGVLLITGTTVLTAEDAGKLIWLAGLGGYNITLPSLATIPSGVAYEFYSSAGSSCSVVVDGADAIFVNGSTVTFVPVGIGDTLKTTARPGTAWAANGGSAQLGYSAAFGASVAPNGYQKLPSGLIIQWGFTASLAPATNLAVTYPIAFPNAVYQVNATPNPIDSTTDGGASVTGTGLAQFTARWGRTAGAGATAQIHWFAIGR